MALPVGLFLAGWLRPAWAVLVVATLLVGIAAWARRLRVADDAAGRRARPVSAVGLGVAGLAVLAVVALLGPGGFGAQTWDWAKHNGILRDLIAQPWPVAYATGGDDVALTYYIAYYLPAAVVGKVAGWTAANQALFAWTSAGALLAFLWIVVLSEAPVWRCLAIFVLFSGLDLVGAAGSSRWRGAEWMHDFDAEWWAGHWVYPSNITLLAYAPHQALGAWLLTGLALDGLSRYPGRVPHVLGGALGLLWSPFAVIGLTGIAALDWIAAWRQRGGLGGLLRDRAELAGAATGLVLSAYLLSRYWPVTLPGRYYPAPDRIAAAWLTFMPTGMGWRAFAADYAVFVSLEFLALAALLGAVYRGRASELRLLGVATATLLLLPLARYGYYNDLAMRVSIPALFTLQVLAAGAPDAVPRRPLLVGMVAVVLVLGAVYPANMLRLRVRWTRSWGIVRIPRESRVRDLFQQQLDLRGAYFHVGQYIGALDAPFFRVLARQPVPAPKGPKGAR